MQTCSSSSRRLRQARKQPELEMQLVGAGLVLEKGPVYASEEDEMSATQPKSQLEIATRLLAGVSVPDTALISRAIEYARAFAPSTSTSHAILASASCRATSRCQPWTIC